MSDAYTLAELKSIPARLGLDWRIEHAASIQTGNQPKSRDDSTRHERYIIRSDGRTIALITAQTRPGTETRWHLSPMNPLPDITRLIDAEYRTAPNAMADLATAATATPRGKP